jgi:hypothetical protein
VPWSDKKEAMETLWLAPAAYPPCPKQPREMVIDDDKNVVNICVFDYS